MNKETRIFITGLMFIALALLLMPEGDTTFDRIMRIITIAIGFNYINKVT